MAVASPIPVVVNDDGWIMLNEQRLTQAESIGLAYALTEAVQRSIDRHQRTLPSYYDSAAILKRMESPLGKALSALRRVF